MTNGKQRLIQELIALYPYLQRCALRLYRAQPHNGEDLVQETMEHVLRSIDSFEGRSTFKTWVTTIMIFRFVTQIRKDKSRRTEPIDLEYEISIPERQFWSAALAEAVTAIEHLSPRNRIALTQAVLGSSQEEIAALLGIPEGTIKSTLHYARQKLQEHRP